MTMLLKNDRLLKTIRREPVDATPVWIMRQAGRYLPEYRAARQKAGSFLKLCKTPEWASLVTLQPLKRFPLDAAILFSDILTIPDAMGLGLYFIEGEGPAFENPLRSQRAIHELMVPQPEEKLTYVLDAIRMVQEELAGKVPLIGFCGSPWTLACYMVEGRANKNFPAIHKMMEEEPEVLHILLEKLSNAVSLHLLAQIKAGVNVVMIFDTWGGLLPSVSYQIYSLQYISKIISSIKAHENTPIILFTKGGGAWLQSMAAAGCDVIGVDSSVDLAVARHQVGKQIALQGNMDTSILYQSEENIQSEVKRLLAAFGEGSGHIFNLGHGVPQDVAPERIACLVDAVHLYSEQYHNGGEYERGTF